MCSLYHYLLLYFYVFYVFYEWREKKVEKYKCAYVDYQQMVEEKRRGY